MHMPWSMNTYSACAAAAVAGGGCTDSVASAYTSPPGAMSAAAAAAFFGSASCAATAMDMKFDENSDVSFLLDLSIKNVKTLFIFKNLF